MGLPLTTDRRAGRCHHAAPTTSTAGSLTETLPDPDGAGAEVGAGHEVA